MVDMPPVVELDTNMGAIVIELNEEKSAKDRRKLFELRKIWSV
ncbi:hypothetical protein PKHYL_12070 [Psychrobacter sp. KH172YL61]|nr:hypothetical protein PKHYL_12070 [Psychrobacter sp. KH172YL61]